MEKEITGIVKQNPIMLDHWGIFVVEQDKDVYLIVSSDRQAVKDHIFVEEGQEIRIRGSCMITEKLKGILITKEAKITRMRTVMGN